MLSVLTLTSLIPPPSPTHTHTFNTNEREGKTEKDKNKGAKERKIKESDVKMEKAGKERSKIGGEGAREIDRVIFIFTTP